MEVTMPAACCINSDTSNHLFRFAGLKILKSLVSRVGGSTPRSVDIVCPTKTSSGQSQSRQLILEALLPHKEQILSLARPSLSDAESTITAISAGQLAGGHNPLIA